MHNSEMQGIDRRAFLGAAALPLHAQTGGGSVEVLNPAARVPVSWIIDDSTCLVNLNRFAIPQFAVAMGTQQYGHDWRSMPHEIPDEFVRRFAAWARREGVKGKWSVVPFPACVGRLDRELPGWTREELQASLAMVRKEIMPNWDIHPEMVTHTRIIDLKTGHPVEGLGRPWMENWDWCAGRSVDQIAEYIAYALQILKNVDMPCEGITSPGGFGAGALEQYSMAAGQAIRHVFGAEIPHYFRNVHSSGTESVKPKIEPGPVVSIYSCTGDWTGNWDCRTTPDPDKYITANGQGGRIPEVIRRGEPAILLSHWTGIHYNGQETGFQAMQQVVTRINRSFKQIRWMKLSEIARYYAAAELTKISLAGDRVEFDAPYGTSAFTIRFLAKKMRNLREVESAAALAEGTWCKEGENVVACFALPKGKSAIDAVR